MVWNTKQIISNTTLFFLFCQKNVRSGKKKTWPCNFFVFRKIKSQNLYDCRKVSCKINFAALKLLLIKNTWIGCAVIFIGNFYGEFWIKCFRQVDVRGSLEENLQNQESRAAGVKIELDDDQVDGQDVDALLEPGVEDRGMLLCCVCYAFFRLFKDFHYFWRAECYTKEHWSCCSLGVQD